jgi:hypothetical protein
LEDPPYLNLLITLDALLNERGVTRAATRKRPSGTGLHDRHATTGRVDSVWAAVSDPGK